jgi:hypothetical protein
VLDLALLKKLIKLHLMAIHIPDRRTKCPDCILFPLPAKSRPCNSKDPANAIKEKILKKTIKTKQR